MIPEPPTAQLRAGVWTRVLAPPRAIVEAPATWAASQALASTAFQAIWFAVVSGLSRAYLDLGIAIVGVVEWAVTTAAMFAIGQLAPVLRRAGRAGRLLGVVVTALTAGVIERVAAGSYWFDGIDPSPFYGVAVAFGALWGLWLPDVGPSSISVPPPPE